MKTLNAKFLISSPNLKSCPTYNLAEFAMIGRSNVGKSSFINKIVNNTKLAKTSNKPGKTRLINFFNVENKFIFADLPGYGFANVAKEMQDNWQNTLEEYLLKREEITSLVVLIDIRHGLLKNDLQMLEWIKFNKLPFFVVLTKADLIQKSKINTEIINLKKDLDCEVFAFSQKEMPYNQKVLDYLYKLAK